MIYGSFETCATPILQWCIVTGILLSHPVQVIKTIDRIPIYLLTLESIAEDAKNVKNILDSIR